MISDASYEYVLQYRHGGHPWAVNIFAVDDADAAQKVESLKATLELKGRLIGSGETLEQAAECAARAITEDALRRASR